MYYTYFSMLLCKPQHLLRKCTWVVYKMTHHINDTFPWPALNEQTRTSLHCKYRNLLKHVFDHTWIVVWDSYPSGNVRGIEGNTMSLNNQGGSIQRTPLPSWYFVSFTVILKTRGHIGTESFLTPQYSSLNNYTRLKRRLLHQYVRCFVFALDCPALELCPCRQHLAWHCKSI